MSRYKRGTKKVLKELTDFELDLLTRVQKMENRLDSEIAARRKGEDQGSEGGKP